MVSLLSATRLVTGTGIDKSQAPLQYIVLFRSLYCRNQSEIKRKTEKCSYPSKSPSVLLFTRLCLNLATWPSLVKSLEMTSVRLIRQHKKLWSSIHWRTLKSLIRFFLHLWLACPFMSSRVLTVPERSVDILSVGTGDIRSRIRNAFGLIRLFYVQNLAKTMYAENLSKRHNMSDLISMRMILNDSLSTFNDVSKARTHVALLWASQANTLPATFWSLFYMIRYCFKD